MGGVSMEWKELQTLVKRKIGYGIVQPGPSVQKGVPIIKVNNIISGLCDTKHLDKTTVENDAKYQRTKLKGGELIVTVVGTCGKTAIVPPQFVGCNLVRATCLIDIEDETICKWIKYYIDSPQGQAYINRNLNTTVQATLNVKNLNEMPIPFYSKEYTSNVVKILSSLDRKIELNNKINADLEEMAQAIFKNWFVDFEPFKDGKFVDSELGMIPEGWKVGSLGDFCNVFTGRKNTNQAIEKGLYPFFSCAPEPLASNEAIFNGKAIIIAGNGSYTGRTSFYNGGFDLYQRTYACTIRERDKENLMIFFYHMMKQFFEPVKMGGTRGSSIPYIVMGDITQQKFPYSEDWLLRFSNIANSMMDKKLRIDKENSRLSLLRDTLLPRLMSGELEVPE